MGVNEETKEYCLQKWNSEDDRIQYFKDHFDEFNNSLTEELGDCMDLLMKKLDYYSHKSINQEYKRLHTRLLEEYDLNLDDTIFTVLKSQRNTFNSSYEYMIEYKLINNINKHCIIPELSDWYDKENWNNINNIVFIDDFCGSGKTFCDYIETIKDKLLCKILFYVVVHIMEDGLDEINKYAKQNKINIIIVCNNIKRAAFSSDKNLEEKKDVFEKECRKKYISKKDIFGYEQTEALVAFFENTPNNTIGILRKDTGKNRALFPRKIEKKPLWQMKEKRKQKAKNNYVRATKSGQKGRIS